VDSGLLDGGLARDFEQPDTVPSDEERTWFRSCNLLISTGAVGYVTERTFEAILPHLGQDHPADFGPIAVVTILRMFDLAPIKDVFEAHGLAFGAVPGVRLPQRRFADLQECRKVLSLLHDKDIDTREWEDRGKQYADLFIAAPERQFPLVLEHMRRTQSEREDEPEVAAYIRR
jgi:hypothetical protein